MSVPAKYNVPALRQPSSVAGRLRKQIRSIATDRENQEFLPAHLEILDAPAAPYIMVFTWVICLMFASAFTWSVLAKLDIYATASGRIQPSGRSKIVQPFETSKVHAVYVHNGDIVKSGDLLIELESNEARAALAASDGEFQSFEAQAARDSATIRAIQTGRRDIRPEFPENVSQSIKARETVAMTADLNQYDAARASLNSQLAENAATQQRYTSSIDARERLKAVLSERSNMREILVTRSAGTRAAVIDALQQVDQVAAELASDRGQLAEAQAAGKSLERRIEQLTGDTIAKLTQSLTEAAQKTDSARQDVIKARVKLDRLRLVSPINGTVQQLAVTTVGQVVTPGQPLLVVVPNDGPIDIEALVLNQDIGFISPGQEVTVKIDSFPFTHYGVIEGKVLRVSRDAIDTHEVSNSTDATSMALDHGDSSMQGMPQTKNLVFPVTIGIARNNISLDGKPVELTAGMTATVEIHTGTRRVIDYMLSPIRETASSAGHER